MTDVVIIPAWRRPGFLAATLRRLLAGDDGETCYLVSVDRRADRQVLTVAQQLVKRLGPTRARIASRAHSYRGNSYNVLTAYRDALDLSPDLVHLVEEDVFVAIDHLDYHRSAHQLDPNTFAVSGARNQNLPTDPDPDPDRAYRHPSYQSIAVSFRPVRLAEVLEHAVPAYFANPVRYCQRTWPGSAIPAGHAEQDGLIHRIIERQRAHVIYPCRPRAYHAGFVGYHRKGERLTGTPEQQATALLGMGTTQLNAAAHSYPDHQAVDLDVRCGAVHSVVDWP